jgi:hypothetical protein
MEENRLDKEIERIHAKFPFLWKDYSFHVKYFTRDYGMYSKGFIIGLENDLCRLVFEKETASSNEPITEFIGKKHSPFLPPSYSYFVKDGWYTLTGLIYWITGVECEDGNDVDEDLGYVSQYLQLYIGELLDLFRYPAEFDKKLEYYRNTYRDRQITVEKIREERARLQGLGLDYSLEEAIKSLRGGKK